MQVVAAAGCGDVYIAMRFEHVGSGRWPPLVFIVKSTILLILSSFSGHFYLLFTLGFDLLDIYKF